MAKERIVNTRFWNDGYTANLDPSEKLLFLYFLTNPYTNISGVYEVQVKQISVDTGFDRQVVEQVLSRFERDKKILYRDGWIIIRNFIRYQNTKNPKVVRGIENELSRVPDRVKQEMIAYGYPIDSLSHLIQSNPNPNLIQMESEHSLAPEVFSLQEEIIKLEDSPERHLNIIAIYLEHRKPNILNREQYATTLSRHIRPAKALVPFSDNQLLKALDHAKREYKDIYTFETLAKLLTK